MKSQKLILKKNPTLADCQRYMAKMTKARGFEQETIPELFMLFLEECGELAEAVRKTKLKHIKSHWRPEHRPDLEAADVLIYLLEIANKLGIDLEKAFREKEEINKQRVWK
ncbi:RS21-C6 protein [Candidatus Uhrbacteria bacterium]|nr:RS21-C6 protein [Candidatus Uhrbacteria bacterium]